MSETNETPADDRRELSALLDLFEVTIADFTALVRALDDAEWEAPTDLPGWSVHDQVSHTAHLEAVLAGAPEDTVAVPDGLSHVRNLTGAYTEQGVIARRARTRQQLVAEIEEAVTRRLAATRADPPTDGAAQPPRNPGGAPWPWRTLLTNRPFDVWMHEQDVRRATGRPGNLDGAAARHAVALLGRGLGYVLVKRAGAVPGESVAIELTDMPVRFAVAAGPDGRGGPAPEGAPVDATLRMSTESFVVLGGGRRTAATQPVTVEGDAALGRRMLESLTVTS